MKIEIDVVLKKDLVEYIQEELNIRDIGSNNSEFSVGYNEAIKDILEVLEQL